MKRTIKEITKDLNNTYQKDEAKFNQLQEELSHSVIEVIKENLRNGSDIDIETEISSVLPKNKLPESVYEETRDFTSNILGMYADLLPLNNMAEKTISFIQECTQRYVVFTDLNFIDEYSKYDFEDKEKMRNTCSALRNIFYSHISNRLAPAYAEEQVTDLFDFNASLSSTYRGLYELYYDKITMNVILAQLNNLTD